MIKLLLEIEKEVENAESRFPEYNSSHEGYAVIAEELDELWELVREHSHDYKKEYAEAKQIACTAVRYMRMCQRFDKELDR